MPIFPNSTADSDDPSFHHSLGLGLALSTPRPCHARPARMDGMGEDGDGGNQQSTGQREQQAPLPPFPTLADFIDLDSAAAVDDEDSTASPTAATLPPGPSEVDLLKLVRQDERHDDDDHPGLNEVTPGRASDSCTTSQLELAQDIDQWVADMRQEHKLPHRTPVTPPTGSSSGSHGQPSTPTGGPRIGASTLPTSLRRFDPVPALSSEPGASFHAMMGGDSTTTSPAAASPAGGGLRFPLPAHTGLGAPLASVQLLRTPSRSASALSGVGAAATHPASSPSQLAWDAFGGSPLRQQPSSSPASDFWLTQSTPPRPRNGYGAWHLDQVRIGSGLASERLADTAAPHSNAFKPALPSSPSGPYPLGPGQLLGPTSLQSSPFANAYRPLLSLSGSSASSAGKRTSDPARYVPPSPTHIGSGPIPHSSQHSVDPSDGSYTLAVGTGSGGADVSKESEETQQPGSNETSSLSDQEDDHGGLSKADIPDGTAHHPRAKACTNKPETMYKSAQAALEDMVGYHQPKVKPTQPYPNLIRLTLLASPTGRLTLSELYEAMGENFPWFKSQGSAWKNSIRHNLSINSAFLRVENPNKDARDKGSLWFVDTRVEPASVRPPRTGRRAGTDAGTSRYPRSKLVSATEAGLAPSSEAQDDTHPGGDDGDAEGGPAVTGSNSGQTIGGAASLATSSGEMIDRSRVESARGPLSTTTAIDHLATAATLSSSTPSPTRNRPLTRSQTVGTTIVPLEAGSSVSSDILVAATGSTANEQVAPASQSSVPKKRMRSDDRSRSTPVLGTQGVHSSEASTTAHEPTTPASAVSSSTTLPAAASTNLWAMPAGISSQTIEMDGYLSPADRANLSPYAMLSPLDGSFGSILRPLAPLPQDGQPYWSMPNYGVSAPTPAQGSIVDWPGQNFGDLPQYHLPAQTWPTVAWAAPAVTPSRPSAQVPALTSQLGINAPRTPPPPSSRSAALSLTQPHRTQDSEAEDDVGVSVPLRSESSVAGPVVASSSHSAATPVASSSHLSAQNARDPSSPGWAWGFLKQQHQLGTSTPNQPRTTSIDDEAGLEASVKRYKITDDRL